LSFSDTAPLSSVMICCTTVVTFNMSLLDELGACTNRPVLADAAAWGTTSFSHMSTVPVVAGIDCLAAVQLHRTALVR
jgi:hypothetical protein